MYSRRAKTEERRNKKNALIFSVLTVGAIILIFIFGIPVVVRFTAFLFELKSSSSPITSEDNNPPPPPFISSVDKATNKDNIELNGSTESGVTVEFTVNGKKDEILADNNGQFTFLVELEDGKNNIIVISRDNAGNESQSTSLTVTQDKKAPELEITSPKDGSEYYGSQQKQLKIEGKTNEDKVKVQINNRLVIVGSDGTFDTTISLAEGDYEINFRLEDEAGNMTEKKISVKFTP